MAGFVRGIGIGSFLLGLYVAATHLLPGTSGYGPSWAAVVLMVDGIADYWLGRRLED